MKSIKPGRGPSMISCIVGLFMIGFGIVWTITAASASPLLALFGVFWTGIAATETYYSFKNAKNKNRYSVYDIVDEDEEPDPLNERYHNDYKKDSHNNTNYFCPYCGNPVEDEFEFCNRCGKRLPR